MRLEPYYSDDLVTIYHGNCFDVLPELDRADVVVTDPPFFMPAEHYSSRTDWQRSWGDTAVLAGWWQQVVDVLVAQMKQTGSLMTFCDDESYPVFYPGLYRRFDRLAALVWDKGKIGMGKPWRRSHELIISARWSESQWFGGGGLSDVLRASSVPSEQRVHPVDKPIDLLARLIAPTTQAGDLVLDPFMGGGSTLRAAKDLGRRAVGIEIEERYCEIAARRLAQDNLFADGTPKLTPTSEEAA